MGSVLSQEEIESLLGALQSGDIDEITPFNQIDMKIKDFNKLLTDISSKLKILRSINCIEQYNKNLLNECAINAKEDIIDYLLEYIEKKIIFQQ